VQRDRGRLWEQFWEFPTVHLEGADPAGRSFGAAIELEDGIKRLTGISARISAPIKTIQDAVTNHRVTLMVHQGEARSGTPRPGPGLVDARWVEPGDLSDYTFSSAGRRLIVWINQDPSSLLSSE
jgi:A/G-specific adenine glycosylase